MCLAFQQMQPKEKMVNHTIPLRPREVLGADIFHFNNKNYLCIVDYHSKLPVIKRMEGLSAESLITTTKVIFAEYGIPQKIMSGTGTNFVSDKFRKFCSRLNIKQAVSSAYHHQSNGQVKACIKFIKYTLKNMLTLVGTFTSCYYKSTLPHWGKVCCLAILLFNCLVHSVMPVIDRKPIGGDNDVKHHSKLVHRQHKK